jgi:hypothetical protein
MEIYRVMKYHQKVLILIKGIKQDNLAHTARPTAPRPNTATVEPFGGFATLIDAPRPIKEKMTTQRLEKHRYSSMHIDIN